MTSGLSIRGVPVETALRMTQADADDSIFALAQAAFAEARGEGTPLLPEPAAPAHRPPAPHLRALLVELLRASAAGETYDLSDDVRARGYMELRLALVEALAARAAGGSALPVVEAAPPAPSDASFLASARPAPSWLPGLVARSRVRTRDAREGALASAARPASGAGLAPQLRLRLESEYWRGVPAHGAELLRLAEGRADALAGAVAAGADLDPAPEELALSPTARPPDPDWVRGARSLLATRASAPLGVPPARPTGGVGRAVLEHFARGAAPASDPPGGRPVVVGPETAAAALAGLDVMGAYDVQDL